MKIITLIIICLITSSCIGSGASFGFKRKLLGHGYEKYKENEEQDQTAYKEGHNKYEECIYGLFFMLIPLNFWDMRFTMNQELNKYINHLKKQNPRVIGAKNITYISSGFTSPLIGRGCSEITSDLIYEDDIKKR